jgi:hypothetical protein
VVLIDCARRQETIAYSELVQKITALDLQAHAPRLDELLGQISTDEIGPGQRMLSVLVVPRPVLKTSVSELAPASLLLTSEHMPAVIAVGRCPDALVRTQ